MLIRFSPEGVRPARRTALFLASVLVAAPLLSTGCDSTAPQKVPLSDPFRPVGIARLMQSVSQDQHRAIMNEGPANGWIQSSFYTGVMAAYRATGDARYRRQATQWAAANDWKLGPRLRHADDHASGQVYLELYQLERVPRRLAHTKETFDQIMADPRAGRNTWHWVDALYMAPPTLARLSTATADSSYRLLLHRQFWDAANVLYDDDEGLFYRDERFLDTDTFWSRGNGWAFAGTVRVLQHLPPGDPKRSAYGALLRHMARALRRTQGEDGLWRSDLLHPDRFPNPETSGTGLFCYGLAWGLNEGYLEAETYRPIVRSAWRGLVRSLDADGRLGWVQPPGDRPERTRPQHAYPYGSGAFLLAGSEVLRMLDR